MMCGGLGRPCKTLHYGDDRSGTLDGGLMAASCFDLLSLQSHHFFGVLASVSDTLTVSASWAC